MVDLVSCAVSAFTEGLWSASLLLNPLKQPYTKPKSSFIPRKGALVQQQLQWNGDSATTETFVFSMSCHMPGSGYTTGPAFYVADIPTFWYLRYYTIHRPWNPPRTWICTGSVTWESLLTERYPLRCSEEVFPMASFQSCITEGSQSGTQDPSPTQQTACIQANTSCLHLATTLSPVWATALQQLSLHLHSGQKQITEFLWPILDVALISALFFLISLQGSSQYHIQTNTYFHSIPLVILSITFFSCSVFPTVTFSTFYTSFTAEVPLSFPELVWVLHWKQWLNYTMKHIFPVQ